MSKEISRREFLKAGVRAAAGVVGVAVIGLPREVEAQDGEELPESLDQALEQAGIDWSSIVPDDLRTYQDAFEAFGVEGNGITAANIVPDIWTDPDDKRYVVGFSIEGFPLQDDVSFDENQGYHVKNNRPVFDRQEIFDFSQGPIHFLVDNNRGDMVMFARTGGIAPSGMEDQVNTSRFGGINVEVDEYVEQAAIIPTLDCDSHTAAYRHALREFTWNTDAQNGTITVEWWNPETSQFETVDGSMFAALAEANVDLSVIERLPANWPTTPEQVVELTGNTTRPENWRFDLQNGQWVFEGFNLMNSGILYDEDKHLHINAQDNVVTDPNEIYNFDDWQNAQGNWPTMMTVGIDNGYAFFRTGGGSGDQPNSAWFGYGVDTQATLNLNSRGFEQVALIPVNMDSCADDIAGAIENAANVDARGHKSRNSEQTVNVWNGSEWTQIK